MDPQGTARKFISASSVENFHGNYLLQDGVKFDFRNQSVDPGAASIASRRDSRRARTFGLRRGLARTPRTAREEK